jgi:VIT1/CCC1 family predicted Fe2+/Mn2+ transporter
MADNNSKNTDISELEKSIQEKMQKLESDKVAVTVAEKISPDNSWWSASDAMTISAIVLIYGGIIMILATVLLLKGRNAEDVLKLFGTMVIVIFAAFLVVAGYTDTQIAPVIGLLGTIAGYLLGSRDKDVEEKDKDGK